MTIILKNAQRTGWKTANGILQQGQALECPTCGAICAEAAAADHDSWHADLELVTLPQFADYVTDEPEADADADADVEPNAEPDVEPSPAVTSSAKTFIRLAELTSVDSDA